MPPECQSPSGYQLCGGPYHCPYEGDTCQVCNLDEEDKATGVLTVCKNDVYEQYFMTTEQVFCMACGDGDICIDKINAGFAGYCGPFELGLLFAQNGAANRVRYADHGLWTGEPLPEPDTCPTIDDVPTCGGKCGTCADDAVCTGRSPLHPYGICASKTSFSFYASCDAIHPCDAGLGCFRWKVQPEAQAEADKFSLCLPLATCKAAAAKIPGGGFCDEY